MKSKLLLTGSILMIGLLPFPSLSQSTRSSNEIDLARRMQDMRALEQYAIRRSERDRIDRAALIAPELDDKTKQLIKEMRMFDKRDIERYRTFLAGEKTGIFKLFPNLDCVSKNLINLSDECKGFVPESSYFSFRSGVYTTAPYHDLGYSGDEIFCDSFFSQGAIVAIGDVPIERISLDLPAGDFLTGLKPDASVSEARQNHQRLALGTKMDGLVYSNSSPPVENTTYLLRNIAYKLANTLPNPTRDTTRVELNFKSLEFDDRADVMVAFRIIRKDAKGGLTIVWKELSRKEAPKLKFGKGDVMADFK